MFVKSLFALAAILVLISPAQARRYQRQVALDPGCNVIMPCILFEANVKAIGKARGHYSTQQPSFDGRRVKTHRAYAAAPAIGPVASSFESSGAIGRPTRYIAGRLVCALNVGSALAERGIKGTGSALAMSYLHWGRASGPVPGAVAVTPRRGGGHVAIVSRVEGGRVFVFNATGGKHGWHEREYTHRHARYRVAA